MHTFILISFLGKTGWYDCTVSFKIKGTLSPRFLGFWVKIVLKFKLSTFSRTQNTPRTSREGNRMINSKGEQTIVSFWPFFQEPKEKLQNINLMLSCCNPFPSLWSAAKHSQLWSQRTGRVILNETELVLLGFLWLEYVFYSFSKLS